MNINEPVFESQILFKVEAIVSGGQESDTVEESDRLAGTNRDSGVKAFTGVIGIKGWTAYFDTDKMWKIGYCDHS